MSETKIKTVKFWSAWKFVENINYFKFLHLYRHMTSIWSFCIENDIIIVILGLKYLRIEVLQVILWFLVKKLYCARFLVAAILNCSIWPLGGTFHLSVGRFWNV